MLKSHVEAEPLWSVFSSKLLVTSAPLKAKMEAAFGSVEACKKELSNIAVGRFGSG
jgi:superoxide dismutase